MRLSGVVKSTVILSSKLGMGELTAGWIIEEFTAQMRAVSKIALHRRLNLASFLEANGRMSDCLIVNVSKIFCMLYGLDGFEMFLFWGCIV